MSRYRNRAGNRCRCNRNGQCCRNGYNPCNREDDDDVIIIPDVPFVPVIGERSPALFGGGRYEPSMHVYRNPPPPPYICCYPVQEDEEIE